MNGLHIRHDIREAGSRTRAHLQRNKKAYIAASIGVIAGGLGTLAFATRRPEVQVSPKIHQILSWKPQASQKVVVELTERSNLSKPCRIKGSTDPKDIFISQADASRKLGISESLISGHLNGKFPEANGVRLEWLEKTGSSSQN
jgi:hypothetical protein